MDQPTYATQYTCLYSYTCGEGLQQQHQLSQPSSHFTGPSNPVCLSSLLLSKVFDWVVVLIFCYVCHHVLVLLPARIRTQLCLPVTLQSSCTVLPCCLFIKITSLLTPHNLASYMGRVRG